MSYEVKAAVIALVAILALFFGIGFLVRESNDDCSRRQCPYAGLVPHNFVQEGCLCVGVPK